MAFGAQMIPPSLPVTTNRPSISASLGLHEFLCYGVEADWGDKCEFFPISLLDTL